jgi:ABC-2 type transport system ATP-binding protein
MVDVRSLNFGYGSKSLFQATNLVLAPGRIYGLLGQNGAGKSTLLRLLSGLLFPNAGTIAVASREPSRREAAFLSDIFVLPENLNIPAVTDREYLGSLSPFYPKFDRERFDRYLRELDVPRGQKLTSLSLGQQKKFLLSFGLACNVSLLLLDEPTNGLDIPSKGLFRRLVAESLSEHQTFVISTHQVRDVESLIDQIVILHEGVVIFNEDIAVVASSLRMSRDVRQPDANDERRLYSEPTIGGYATVWREESEGESQLDLEVLFKAVVARPETYRSMFGRKEGAHG